MANGLKATTTLEELAELLQNNTYTPQTDEQRRQQAESLYKNQLDAARLAAQQSYDSSVTALTNQLNDLQTNYDRQAESQRTQTAQAMASADRQALSRGMQRSSYNNATLANLNTAGNKALAQIEQNRTNDLSDIDAQKTLLANQLQQNLSSAQSAYETNVLNRIAELQDQDYQRQQTWQNTQNELLMQLYKLQQAAKTAGSGGSGGGGGSQAAGRTSAGTGTAAASGSARNYASTTKAPQIVTSPTPFIWAGVTENPIQKAKKGIHAVKN